MSRTIYLKVIAIRLKLALYGFFFGVPGIAKVIGRDIKSNFHNNQERLGAIAYISKTFLVYLLVETLGISVPEACKILSEDYSYPDDNRFREGGTGVI